MFIIVFTGALKIFYEINWIKSKSSKTKWIPPLKKNRWVTNPERHLIIQRKITLTRNQRVEPLTSQPLNARCRKITQKQKGSSFPHPIFLPPPPPLTFTSVPNEIWLAIEPFHVSGTLKIKIVEGHPKQGFYVRIYKEVSVGFYWFQVFYFTLYLKIERKERGCFISEICGSVERLFNFLRFFGGTRSNINWDCFIRSDSIFFNIQWRRCFFKQTQQNLNPNSDLKILVTVFFSSITSGRLGSYFYLKYYLNFDFKIKINK